MKDSSFLYQPEDLIICEKILLSPRWKEAAKTPVHELALMVGEYFLRAPYEANTIDREGPETLIVNLRQFDCFTFVENVIVLARLIAGGKTTFRDFTEHLANIRYRQGRLRGYASRLHYFFDWMEDNGTQGIVKDITSEIGGKPCCKEIHFMTNHREKYPPLKDDQIFQQMLAFEKELSKHSRHVIPKADVEKIEDNIADGSIIGVTTTVAGLDVAHVGIALRENRRVHLLHASLEEKKVVVSKDTLHDYLRKKENMSGILVGWIQSMRAMASVKMT